MTKNRILLVGLVLLVLSPVIVLFFFKKVEPGVIGVRQNRWGGGGIYDQDFESRLVVGITGIHRWHYLPRKTHFLHFNAASKATRDEISEVVPPLEIRTRDGNPVTIELSIPYRIREGEGHKIVREGQKSTYRGRVKSVVADVLRIQLAELSPEEMVVTERRLQRASEALGVLNEELKKYHVVAEKILIRKISFAPNYEQKLQEKQYLNQKANLDVALREQADEEKVVNLKEAEIQADMRELNQEWEKKLQVLRSDFQVQIARIRSEGELNAERIRAEGDKERIIAQARGRLALDQAEALRDELRNAALSSYGGRILLALDAVDKLNMPEVTLNSDDPAVPMVLDLHRMTRLLVGDQVD